MLIELSDAELKAVRKALSYAYAEHDDQEAKALLGRLRDLSPADPPKQRSEWPEPGEKLRFNAVDGIEYQIARALELFEPGQLLTVKDFEVGPFSSLVEFEEAPGKRWNSVMFDRLEGTE